MPSSESVHHPDCRADMAGAEGVSLAACARDRQTLAPGALAMLPLIREGGRAVGPGPMQLGQHLTRHRATGDRRRCATRRDRQHDRRCGDHDRGRRRFNDAFWNSKEEFFALALDGRKDLVRRSPPLSTPTLTTRHRYSDGP